MDTFLKILVALPDIIKSILELMNLAEKALPDKNNGAAKKEYVLVALESIIGNNELWSGVKNLFSKIINVIALFNFNSSGKDPEPTVTK